MLVLTTEKNIRLNTLLELEHLLKVFITLDRSLFQGLSKYLIYQYFVSAQPCICFIHLIHKYFGKYFMFFILAFILINCLSVIASY